MANSGLQGMNRLPRDTVRARRNATQLASNFTSLLGDGLAMSGAGLITIDLAANPGLAFSGGDLMAKVAAPIALDATGIHLDYTTGLTLDGTNLVVDDTVYVPYTGATADVDLGAHNLITTGTVTGNKFYHTRSSTETTTFNYPLELIQTGSGDMGLSITAGGTKWRVGVDNSQADNFAISNSANEMGGGTFVLTTGGNVQINNYSGLTGGGHMSSFAKINADTIETIYTATLDRGGGVGGVGLGLAYLFQLENGAGLRHGASKWIVEWIDSADGSEDSATTFQNMVAGSYIDTLKLSNNVEIPNDNSKLLLGTGNDASIFYDGVDLHINSQEVGNGHIILNSPKTTTGDPAGVEGKIYWNTVDNVIKMYADGAWRTLASW